MLDPFSRLLWDCLWQSTSILAVAALFCTIWRHWPARAHRVVALALLACLVTPMASQIVRRQGWGILAERRSAQAGLVARQSSLETPGPAVQTAVANDEPKQVRPSFSEFSSEPAG